MKTIKLSVFGDICIPNQLKKNTPLIVDESLSKIISNKDLVIGNLECPVTDSKYALEKNGPCLKSSLFLLEYLKKIGINLVTLANNHIMDFGSEGLKDTLNNCKSFKIQTTGANFKKETAKEPFIFRKGDFSIGIINSAEIEFSAASLNTPGANPYDIIAIYNQIISLKKKCQKIILIVHGGIENFHLPSKQQRKEYRFFAENGVDMIICHHSHRVSGYEIWNNTPIFYGLGNFIFAGENKEKEWFSGIILNLEFSKNNIDFTIHPTIFDQENNKINILKGSEKDIFNKRIKSVSEIIKNDKFLTEEIEKFVHKQSKFYLKVLFNRNNRLERILIDRLGFESFFFKKKQWLFLRNFFECDAHNYIIKKILKKENEHNT